MFPDLTLFYMSIYGGFGYENDACQAYLGLATGIPQTGNPPYTAADFLAMYPKFGGVALPISATLTGGSAVVPYTGSGQGIGVGQLVSGAGVPAGSTIVSLSPGVSFTLSNAATLSGPQTLSIYTAPPIPLAVMQVYLNLAYASLMSSRWREGWALGMALYIAHFLTLYAQSEGNSSTDPGEIAAAGLERGIAVSKSVGDVSVGLQNLAALNSWAAWGKTTYGTQLATLARVVGCGPIYVR